MNSRSGIVFVVDDDASVRKAASRLFHSVGLEVCTFKSAVDFLGTTRPDLPGCLVLDVNMPELNGMELQNRLAQDDDDLPIVFLTGHGDIPMSVMAIKNGANDFLTKPVDTDQLLTTVLQAIESHSNDRKKVQHLALFRERIGSLTHREREVMMLVITGMLNKQIARKLEISEATVKVHRGRVMEKSGIDSVAELVRCCERAGLSVDFE